MALKEIGTGDDLNPQGKTLFTVDGLSLLVVEERGELYAMSNICPHAGGKLNEGRVENGAITCLNHGASFDLKSGQIRLDMLEEELRETIDEDNLPFGPATVYPLCREGDRLMVDLP
ncbi:MAG: Rieske (2Fe-2S) protein [Spirochaetales bacterium]|nr:Rieske (2Fe-2S) protein [Spirochaetales bacterium]